MNTLVPLKSPISVNFETTQVCNLRCSFCFSTSATYIHKNPPLDHVKRIIDALAEAEVFEIRWFGGEFTALKGWQDALLYAHSKGFFMGFVSNGTILTQEDAKLMATLGISGGAMSLHGLEDTHDSVVGVKGAFRKTIEGIKICKDAGIGITALFTPTRENLKTLYPLATWLRGSDIPISEIDVGRLCPSGEAASGWDDRRLDLEDYRFLFKEMRRIQDDTGMHAYMGDAFPLCLLPYRDWDLVTGCWQGTGFGQISVSGDLKSCSILKVSYGNILETPLTEIWTEKLKTMRSLAHLPRQCRMCPHFCGGGCSASKVGATHFAPDEFIPSAEDESLLTMARRIPGLLDFYVHRTLEQFKRKAVLPEVDLLIESSSRPRIKGEYRMRQDSECHIGFFKSRGILTFDSLSASIMSLVDGVKSVEEITRMLDRGSVYDTKTCAARVKSFISQMVNAGFMTLTT